MSTTKIFRLLRYTWVLLFLWFGYMQLMDPAAWVGYLPEWTGYFPIPGEMIVRLNGWAECIGALLLALGIWQRPVFAILSLHLFGISIIAGGAVGVRDAALAMIGVALFLAPKDEFPFSQKEKK